MPGTCSIPSDFNAKAMLIGLKSLSSVSTALTSAVPKNIQHKNFQIVVARCVVVGEEIRAASPETPANMRYGIAPFMHFERRVLRLCRRDGDFRRRRDSQTITSCDAQTEHAHHRLVPHRHEDQANAADRGSHASIPFVSRWRALVHRQGHQVVKRLCAGLSAVGCRRAAACGGGNNNRLLLD